MTKEDRNTICEFLLILIALLLLISMLTSCSKKVVAPIIVHDTIEHSNIVREYAYTHDTIYRDSIRIEYIDSAGTKIVKEHLYVYKSKDSDKTDKDSTSLIHSTTPAEEIVQATISATEQTAPNKVKSWLIPFVIGIAIGLGSLTFFAYSLKRNG